MALCRFTGGPLDGEEREIDLYIHSFPYGKAKRDEQGNYVYIGGTYTNHNTVMVDETWRNNCLTHYVWEQDYPR